MLTIKNIENTKRKEFSFLGNEWILFEVDVNNLEYKFIFIPMDAGRYDLQKTQLVVLNRTKHKRRGYPLWTTDGHFTYINTNQIKNWQGLVEVIWQKGIL
jgi:hypothetical protein